MKKTSITQLRTKTRYKNINKIQKLTRTKRARGKEASSKMIHKKNISNEQ
jgi:hypothetical protein